MHRFMLFLLFFGTALVIPPFADAEEVRLPTPRVGSRFDYLWSYGGLESYTIISHAGGRLRARLEQDFENDGTVDEVGVQYWDLNSRLWLAHMGANYVSVYSPRPDVELPTAIFDGLYFSGDFDLVTSDGLSDVTSSQQMVNTSCDYLLSDNLIQTQVGTFETIDMVCSDFDIEGDGSIPADPSLGYYYTEAWSLALGMPVVQSFGIDQSTGEAADTSVLIAYELK